MRSLDLLRGVTVAFMILVNDAGDWDRTWAPLLHAPWHGWTPTDLVFPFFLFVVGAAIPFALPEPPLEEQLSGAIHRKVLRRSAILFLLGLALIWFPYYTVVWERARIFGVLQRIGIVYLAAALAWLHLRRRGRAILATALLAGYWIAMKTIPVPGFVAGDLSAKGNFTFHVDHLILGPHIWRYSPGPGDPEGILSTIPAIATALLGIFAGEFLLRRHNRTAEREAPPPPNHLPLASAFFLVAAGLALAPLFPINKNLWSPTYVLFTAGLATLALVGIHLLVDGEANRERARWAIPFERFGRQAIVVYVGSGALARILGLVKIGEEGAEVSLQKWLYARLFASWLPDYWASFGWALAFVLLFLGVASWLDRRGFALRI